MRRMVSVWCRRRKFFAAFRVLGLCIRFDSALLIWFLIRGISSQNRFGWIPPVLFSTEMDIARIRTICGEKSLL